MSVFYSIIYSNRFFINYKYVEMDNDDIGESAPMWDYNLNEALKLKYTIDVDKTNPSYNNNFVKSIKMSPSGYSFIYSCEDGIVRYVNLAEVDFWGVNAEEQSLLALQPSYHFNHTEIVYGMDWYN